MSKKLVGLTMLVFVLGLAQASLAAWDPNTDASLLGYWKFDDGSGGTVKDSSPNGINGTITGAPIWVAGHYGGGMQFDGIDDYVDTTTKEDLAKWTICCWFTSPAAPALTSPTGPVHREQNYQINWNHGDSNFIHSAAMDVGGTWYSASFGTALKANTWYHLTATYDGETLKAYTNGKLITANANPSGAPVAESNTLKFCRHAAAAQDDPDVTTEASSSQARAGMGQPAVIVPATRDWASLGVLLRDLDAPAAAGDLTAGLLSSATQPNLLTRPGVTLLKIAAIPGTSRDYQAQISVHGLFAFGESSAPLLYKGRQVETLRFAKPGLLVKAALNGEPLAREGNSLGLPLVLENPSGFAYQTVRARLRFDDRDLCQFSVEKFSAEPAAAAQAVSAHEARTNPGCDTYLNWATFSIPRYAQVTLRAQPPAAWFRDPGTGFARSGKKKGVLTLRFEGAAEGLIHEQDLPLEVQFQPSATALSRSLGYAGAFLVLGAALSLLLRVAVPNVKRKRQLKDQLSEAAKRTASISTEVDSTLRVLLRVERLALEEVRQDAFAFSPNYADYAQRVEQALPTLKRRIEAVRRLDATLIRLRLLMEQNPAPTLIGQVEAHLDAVSGTLKQDNLSDEDWVFVTQRLESAQKLLREPTQSEKDGFDALLLGRWKAISEHFGRTAQNPALQVPASLNSMQDCFPDAALLPQAGDEDGTKWIAAIGATRADLQLSALSLVWEFEFLLPKNATDAYWAQAQVELTRLLATPVLNNLREARSLLRQLAERVRESDVVRSLQDGAATIVMDPAIPRPNQRIRFSVKFRDASLNACAARELVACRWCFSDKGASRLRQASRSVPMLGARLLGRRNLKTERALMELCEDGWSVHHYFEKGVDHSVISVEFHDSKGQRIELPEATMDARQGVWHLRHEAVLPSRRPQEQWARGWLEVFQLVAALLVPLATLASQTVNEASVGNWWQLIAIGFASDTIKSILVGRQESSSNP